MQLAGFEKAYISNDLLNILTAKSNKIIIWNGKISFIKESQNAL